MAEIQRTVGHVGAGTRAADIDAGLRAHMNKVYGLMAGGVALSGVTAWAVSGIPAITALIWGTPLKWLVIFSPLIFVFVIAARMHKMSVAGANAAFWSFAALMGLSLSSIFLNPMFNNLEIAQAFFLASIAFLSMSLYGYTTKKSLSGWGSFLFMGVIGVVLASILNLFIQSSALMFALNVVVVLVFAGLTAYDSQRIKNEYLAYATAGPEGRTWLEKAAIMGALGLYINFINMFQSILMLIGMGDE